MPLSKTEANKGPKVAAVIVVILLLLGVGAGIGLGVYFGVYGNYSKLYVIVAYLEKLPE